MSMHIALIKKQNLAMIENLKVLLEDLYFLDVNKLTPEIERYIKDTYGKSEIQQYFSVKKDGKNYYKVIILPNKEKYPKYLWFTATGEFDRVEE